METLLPTVQKFGNRLNAFTPLIGVTRLSMSNESCARTYIEIEGYHDLPSGESVRTILLIPLKDFTLVMELFEHNMTKIPGTYSTIGDLPQTDT